MKEFNKDRRHIIAPSLICLDMLHLEQQVRELEEAGIQMLHVDILDGHFSPSMPLGFELVRQLRKVTDIAFDCHVMVHSPQYFIDELLDIGVEQITFHLETAPHVDGLLNYIRAKNVRAGVALKPATPLGMLDYIIELCDVVLLMQINPGYASIKNEKQVPYAGRKIQDLRKMIEARGLGTEIEIDGRVSVNDIHKYGNGMVDIFVGGTTCIDREHIRESIRSITGQSFQVG